jgi:hypothetical protein
MSLIQTAPAGNCHDLLQQLRIFITGSIFAIIMIDAGKRPRVARARMPLARQGKFAIIDLEIRPWTFLQDRR